MSNGIRWLNLWCCKKSQGNNASGQPQLLYLHVSSKFQDSFQRKRYWSGDANLLWLGFEDVRMIVDIHGYTVFLFQLWGWGFHGDIIGKDELLCIWESPFQVHPLATFWSKSPGEFKIQIYTFMHCDILKQKLSEATDAPRFVNMIAISFRFSIWFDKKRTEFLQKIDRSHRHQVLCCWQCCWSSHIVKPQFAKGCKDVEPGFISIVNMGV